MFDNEMNESECQLSDAFIKLLVAVVDLRTTSK